MATYPPRLSIPWTRRIHRNRTQITMRRVFARLEGLYYKLMKSLLKTSKLGYGLVVSGAESGTNFEHIYDAKPQGSHIVGRIVDRALLNLPSAQATRARKEQIRKFLWNEIHNNRLLGKKTRVLDLAAGTSRYLRELSEEHKKGDVESVCIDRDVASVKLGSIRCKAEGLTNLRFVRADIFELNRLRNFSNRLKWRANVVVAAGLLMYFNDRTVETMLKEIYEYLPEHGVLIFSSLERLEIRKLMRKTMSVSAGGAWVLYDRTPEYWRDVLFTAGFREIVIMRDRWQLQNVCSARKP